MQQHDRHQWMVILCWLVSYGRDPQLAQRHISEREGTDWCNAGLSPARLWSFLSSSEASTPDPNYQERSQAEKRSMRGTSQRSVREAASGTQRGVTGNPHLLGCCLNTKQELGHVMGTLQCWLHLDADSEIKMMQNISGRDRKCLRKRGKEENSRTDVCVDLKDEMQTCVHAYEVYLLC